MNELSISFLILIIVPINILISLAIVYMTSKGTKNYQIAALLAMLFVFTCVAVIGMFCKKFLEYLIKKLITDEASHYNKNMLEM